MERVCKVLGNISRCRMDCVLDRENRKSIFASISPADWNYLQTTLLSDVNNYYSFISSGGVEVERQIGCYMGMVVGDALGAPIEFLSVVDDPTLPSINITPDGSVTYPYETFNVFHLHAGQWTDDASMGACIADSLLVHSPHEPEKLSEITSWSTAFSARDIRSRFWNWTANGYNNAFLHCSTHDPYRSVGLGGNIAKSLRNLHGRRFEDVADYYESHSEDSGIGGLMRLAAVPIYYSDMTIELTMKFAALSSQTTHPGDIATRAAEFLAYAIHRAIHRSQDVSAAEFIESIAEEYTQLLASQHAQSPAHHLLLRLLRANEPAQSQELSWNWKQQRLNLVSTMVNRGKEYNGYPNNPGYYGSYCMDGLAVALNSFRNTTSFAACLEMCINYRGDADSTAAVVGQLAGAFYGIKSIPPPIIASTVQWDDGEHMLRALMLTPWFREQQQLFFVEEDRSRISYQHEDAKSVGHTTSFPEYEYPAIPLKTSDNAKADKQSVFSRLKFLKWMF